MPAIINSDSGAVSGSAGLKIYGNSDGILEIQNNGVTSVVVANSYIRVPVGNTQNRPSISSAGMFRFNTSSGAFETYNGTNWNSILPSDSFNLEVLAVAGGGSGGSSPVGFSGGGGGGGGIFSSNVLVLRGMSTGLSYLLSIGAGGAIGANGSPSIFVSNTIVGGGRGTPGVPGSGAVPLATFGHPGGSGSGGGGTANTTAQSQGGSGFNFPGPNQQGFPGGRGFGGAPAAINGGGGGGGSQAGFNANITIAGKGGDGFPSLITGANIFYAGGGGGASSTAGAFGRGGAGGGGNGGVTPGNGAEGNVNTGGGGGAGGSSLAGGSGIIILAHSNTISNGIVSAGLTYTINTISRPGFLVYSFTAGAGTITWI
jgi:hypothetical protein